MKTATAIACLSVLAIAAVGDAAGAEAPNPESGRWLGLLINCRCVQGNRQDWLDYFKQRLVAIHGEKFYNSARSYIELGLNETWDNQSQICANACANELVEGWQKGFDRRDDGVSSKSKPAASPITAARSSPALQKRPIAVQWDGVEQLIAGTVAFSDTAARSGEIQADLPRQQGTCRGHYRFHEAQAGTWSISCSNGLAAAGTLSSHGAGAGSSGSGTDAQGRSVKFTVGAAR